VFEWEELPSLASMLRDLTTGAGPVGHSTEPMPLQAIAAPMPVQFAEPIHGLQIREIGGDSLFSHFFGAPRALTSQSSRT
jgi:hypothetical protein